MRIAVWHNLGAGGAKRFLYQHVKGLVARGHEVEAWCLSTADAQYLPLGSIVKEHVVPLSWKFPRPRTPLGKAFHYYYYSRERLNAAMRAYRQCANEMNAGRFDVCLAGNCQITGIPSLGAWLQIPKVLYIQDPNRRLYEAMPESIWLPLPTARSAGRWQICKAKLKDWARIQRERMALHFEQESAAGFDALLANSYFSRESILRAYGRDAVVCYPGIDTDFFRDRAQQREPLVIGVGSFAWHKNIPFAIDAVAMLASPRPPLVWVGNGGSRNTAENLRQYAAGVGVQFEPRFDISDADLKDLFNRARAMVFCPRLEPFGLAPLEANACGLPVVGIKEGGLRETICDGVNGLLVEPSREAVAEGLKVLLKGSDIQSWALSSRQYVEQRWNLSDAVIRLEQQLERVAAHPKPLLGDISSDRPRAHQDG